MKQIDIFILCYKREKLTEQTLKYLFERTSYPFRVFLLIQEDDKGNNFIADAIFKNKIFMKVNFSINGGVHMAWNTAFALAESEYFITSDNDILVPELRGLHKDKEDWLGRLVNYMDKRPDYGAISLHPHVFIGAAGIDPTDREEVKERNMCGAVMRIMRREAVQKAGGWEHKIEAGRNHEEKTICSRLQINDFKVGICSRIRAWHEFGGKNWGYPDSFTPEQQKHNPELSEYVQQFNNKDPYDLDTWMPK